MFGFKIHLGSFRITAPSYPNMITCIGFSSNICLLVLHRANIFIHHDFGLFFTYCFISNDHLKGTVCSSIDRWVSRDRESSQERMASDNGIIFQKRSFSFWTFWTLAKCKFTVIYKIDLLICCCLFGEYIIVPNKILFWNHISFP